MLVRHLADDPELGYCQGLHNVAAIFAIADSSPQRAYRRFASLVENMRGFWLPGFPLLWTEAERLQSFAKNRPWFKHFRKLGVEPSMYLPQAWLTLFAAWLPLSTIVDCLPLLETGGSTAMLALTIQVLDDAERDILNHRDSENVLLALRSLQSIAPCSAKLLVSVSRLLARLLQAPHIPGQILVEQPLEQPVACTIPDVWDSGLWKLIVDAANLWGVPVHRGSVNANSDSDSKPTSYDFRSL